jgi:hypothetical protein
LRLAARLRRGIAKRGAKLLVETRIGRRRRLAITLGGTIGILVIVGVWIVVTDDDTAERRLTDGLIAKAGASAGLLGIVGDRRDGGIATRLNGSWSCGALRR